MQKEVTKSTNDTWLVPAYNVSKEDESIILRIEMPGVDKDNLDITVENNQLFVTGHREEKAPEGAWLIRERRRGNYRRVFTLDDTTDPEAISAEIAHGVVTMRIGFKATAKPRKIEVKAH
ncbi:MAG: Hsp20/alpha crystallin family protein [Spirochaetaceae bacterium]|nr:MAG: Hsp20/alpha crystallin family protein [Spirochaetaceae bacterium]